MTDRQGLDGPRNSIDQGTTHSVVRTHYEDDNDDNHDIQSPYSSEQTPLISSATANGLSGLNIHHHPDGSDHSLHTLLQKPLNGATQERGHGRSSQEQGQLSMSWKEWTVKNGIHPSTWTKHTYLRALLLTTLLTLVILAFTVLRVQDHIKDILSYIDDHRSMGAVLFVAFYTVACWLFLPGSLFTIGAGFLFKPMPFALAIVLLGDALGAIGSFLFGRYIFYAWVKGMMSKHPKFNALDEVIQDEGWKIVVMLRLTPIPFNLITYFFSITSISLYTLVWATLVGVFPGSCLGIWIGSLLKGLSGIDNPELETKNVVVLIMNGVFIVCSILTLSIFGKRSLRKAMGKLDEHQHDQDGSQGLLSAQEGGEDSNENDGDLEAPTEDDSAVNRPDVEASNAATVATAPTGFTRGEKWIFVGIAVAAVVNVSVCIPLYYHYANQDQ
ncbi:snare associated Golgi protein-domain-containing protein [Dissophora ornata]|nr:hypothetical protein BGZ58_007055 [Dissophora ornata]KAI8602585.1 snare associated Golgi protein-domain-containing protein [Dissophora ornata]